MKRRIASIVAFGMLALFFLLGDMCSDGGGGGGGGIIDQRPCPAGQHAEYRDDGNGLYIKCVPN